MMLGSLFDGIGGWLLESVRRNPAACERTRKGIAARAERGTRTAVIGGMVAAGFIGKAAPSAGSIEET